MNTLQFFIPIISYILGFLSGFLVSLYFKKSIDKGSYKHIVLIVISVMWTISVAFEIANPDYKTSPLIHGLMGSIVGFFYKFEPKK